MAFSLSAEQCSYLANLFSGVVRQKRLDSSPVPVCLSVADGVLDAAAQPESSLVTCIRTQISTVSGSGFVVAPGSKLVDILRRASQTGGIDVDEVDGVVKLGSWKITALTPFSTPVDPTSFQAVDRHEFISCLRKISWAISTDMVRPRLTLARLSNGFIRACDGMRYCEQRGPSGIDWEVSGFVIPLLSRYFEAGSETLNLGSTDSHQIYRSGAVSLYVPKPAAGFLDLDSVVAEPARNHNNFLLRLDRNDLLSGLQDISVLSDSTSVVQLQIGPETCLLSSTNGLDRVEVSVPCSWDGEPRELHFFVRPLLDFVKASQSDVLQIRLGTSTLKNLSSAVIWEDGLFCLINQARAGV